MTPLARRLAWQRSERDADRKIDMRAYVLATFTVNPLAPYLGTALQAAGFEPAVDIGPFDQIRQELLTGQGSDADVVVVWPRLEDLWSGGPSPLVRGDTDDALDNLRAIGELCVASAASWGVTFVVVLPAIPDARPLGVGDAGNPFGVGAAAAVAREALRECVAGRPGVLVVDADDVIRTIGSRQAIDHRRMAAASIPYTEEAFALAGDRIGALLRIDRKGAKKVAVVDADNTLWGGVVGEEGAAGVDLADQGPGVSYRAFQRYLTDLRRAGMLVAVASKNNEADALEVFERREMVLRLGDLASWRIDWNPKSSNIEAMADELNLGVASMVFIDDSAMEVAEVGVALPDVTTIQMPEDPAGWFDAIAGSGALDRLPPTQSDLGRAESYAQETRRKQVRSATDLGAFLASLHLAVEVFAPAATDLARLAQLIAKTNQFTLGGVRHNEAVLARLVSDPDAAVRLVHAKDDFGDYGVIGAFVVTGLTGQDGAPAVLDSFVLSCRAMARGVEDAMLAAAAELAGERRLVLTAVDAPKNQPLRSWLARLGLGAVGVAQDVTAAAWPAHVERVSANGDGN